MSINTNNTGLTEGRLAKNPVIMENKDGSKRILLTLAVKNNYASKDGKTNSDFLNFETFIAAGKELGPYALTEKGDLVKVTYTPKSNNYENKLGEKVYSQILYIENVEFRETLAVKQARQTAKADVVPVTPVADVVPVVPVTPVADVVPKKKATAKAKAKTK